MRRESQEMESLTDGGGEGGWSEGTRETVQGSLENGQGSMGQPSDHLVVGAPVSEDRGEDGGVLGNDVQAEGSDKVNKEEADRVVEDEEDEEEMADLVLFQVKECYVYKIPPRKSNLSYRADEWDINNWTWQGALRVVSKGTSCSIRLEDPNSGELFAQSPIRVNEPLPLEAVVDSSRFFVLRVEDSSGPHVRHAFVGVGFRERTQAYDFNAALQDHLKYVHRKREAEEAAKEYRGKTSTDYSLKEGQTLRLQIRTSTSARSYPKQNSPLLADRSSGKRLSATSGGTLFADPQVGNSHETGCDFSSSSAGAGAPSPSLPPPAQPGETADRSSTEDASPRVSTASAALPATVIRAIVPPPPPPAGFANFALMQKDESNSDVCFPDFPSEPVISDVRPDEEDFGEFHASGSSGNDKPSSNDNSV
ncbi:hypothetical protein CBR_g11118 [Chara braunii]|uniref:NECAP PHear domain-containing protein n=1 Tax=Chara braunii TaxID=69332 RepID=A0A388KQ60_CHABU|nr:hypothetical protein CBR_g11118 [Chara braunii]|eukprot:GBG72185.1 hypothetical protein CBR_g11118 [Chara braunii]